jgi:ACT domain-containing protein
VDTREHRELAATQVLDLADTVDTQASQVLVVTQAIVVTQVLAVTLVLDLAGTVVTQELLELVDTLARRE